MKYYTVQVTNLRGPSDYIPYNGKIWRGLKFGDLASSLLTKFNSSPNLQMQLSILNVTVHTGQSIKFKICQMLKSGILPNILPTKFSLHAIYQQRFQS